MIDLIIMHIPIKEPLKTNLECLFAVAHAEKLVFFGEGAFHEGQKTVDETGIHGGSVVSPLLSTVIIMPYHGSLTYILDS